MPEISVSPAILDAAKYLAGRDGRYLSPSQLVYVAKTFRLTKDQARAATVVADRIRRAAQIAEDRPSFRVDRLIAPDAPIVLMPTPPKRKGKQ